MATLDVDTIITRATPLSHQQAHAFSLSATSFACLSLSRKRPPRNRSRTSISCSPTRSRCAIRTRSITGRSPVRRSCRHLLFDKHAGEQTEIVDSLAERIQALGGVCLAMGSDVGETTLIPRPPKGREPAPVPIHGCCTRTIVIKEARAMGRVRRTGDDGTNDLIVSAVIRQNEQQVWFLASTSSTYHSYTHRPRLASSRSLMCVAPRFRFRFPVRIRLVGATWSEHEHEDERDGVSESLHRGRPWHTRIPIVPSAPGSDPRDRCQQHPERRHRSRPCRRRRCGRGSRRRLVLAVGALHALPRAACRRAPGRRHGPLSVSSRLLQPRQEKCYARPRWTRSPAGAWIRKAGRCS